MMHSNSWPWHGSWATPFLDPEGCFFSKRTNHSAQAARYKGRLVVSTPISTIISTIIHIYIYIYKCMYIYIYGLPLVGGFNHLEKY